MARVYNWQLGREMSYWYPEARPEKQFLTDDQFTEESDKSSGVLLASGYIAGGAIAGIIIAFLAGAIVGGGRQRLFTILVGIGAIFALQRRGLARGIEILRQGGGGTQRRQSDGSKKGFAHGGSGRERPLFRFPT